MIPKGQIDSKYKEALRDFNVAPREEQWQRLEFALRKEKKRRFLWLWFRGFVLFLCIASAAATSYWYYSQEDKVSANMAAGQPNAGVRTQPEADRQVKDENSKAEKSETRQESGAEVTMPIAKGPAQPDNAGASGEPASGTPSISRPAAPAPYLPAAPSPAAPVIADSTPAAPDWVPFLLSPRKMALLALLPPRIQASLIVDWTSGVPVLGKKTPTPDPLRGLFVAAAWGFGRVENPISFIQNESKQHKDQSLLFEQFLGNYKSNAWQLGLEYRPKKGPRFSVSGGIQYRELMKDVNFDYTYRDFPIMDMDGNIIGYERDSSGNGLTFNIQQKTGIRFIGFPLYLQYPVWSAGGNELTLGGGLMLQAAVGARGNFFNAASLQVRALDASAFDAFSVGYQLGAAYNRHIWKPLYFCAEARYGRNPQELKLDQGNIQSHLQGLQLQFGLKVKMGR